MLKPYNDYKMTKYDWMGNIPVHWDTQKIRELFTERKEKVSDKDYAPLSVSRGGVVPQISTVAKSNDSDNRKLVRYGDFVINSRSDRRGSSGISVYDGSVSLINIVLCPRSSLNGRYTHFLLRSHSFIEEYYRNGRGIVADLWTTRYAEMKSIVLPVPPREEQDQIVRYLDWQVSKINKLISARKKQIVLLKEQKQAVINEVVTKGLDPAVPMKDSGIEWCGEIPAEWRIDKIPRLFSSIGSGTTPASGNAKYYRDGTIPWINSGDLYTDKKRVESAGKSVNELALTDYSVLKLYQEAACVIAMYGASIGNAAIVDFPFCCNQACCVLSDPREDLLLDYIYYCTSTFKRYLIEKSRGGGQPNISQDMIRKVWIPLPDIDTQKKIVEYIDVQCAKTDALIESINWEITLLKEYRTRLISDVVTGQIDVRDIEVPEFEYIADEADDVSDDENIDAEEAVEEEE